MSDDEYDDGMSEDEHEEDLFDYDEEDTGTHTSSYSKSYGNSAYDETDQYDAKLSFKSFSPSGMKEEIDKEVNDVAAIMGLDYPTTSILLRRFLWSRDRLLESYIDSPESVLSDIGVKSESESPRKRIRLQNATSNSVSSLTCDICCMSSSESMTDIYRARCGHAFCTTCWRDYLTIKIKEETSCDLTCMQTRCNLVMFDDEVKNLIDEEVYERYKENIINSYVSHNKHLKFCPYPDCSRIIRSNNGVGKSTILTIVPIACCSEDTDLSETAISPIISSFSDSSTHPVKQHVFCFWCGIMEDHRPTICPVTALWEKRGKDAFGNTTWIVANTKECPSCKNPTEKNGGCDRMACRNCTFEWCWLCQKKWSVHGYLGKCNAFKEPAYEKTQVAQAEARAQLEKWSFYYDRFANHDVSTKLEKKLVKNAEKKMTQIINLSRGSNNEGGLSWIEASFLRDAVDALTKCRLTLKWSYVVGYYIQPGNMKQIFEDIQADLEKAVEVLSELLEETITSTNIRELRLKVVDKTIYVKKRHVVMLRDVSAGLREGRWKWTVPIE